MDTSDPYLHDDDFLLSWDRLEVSQTSRQIFAETAFRYHAMKLQPIADMVHDYDHEIGAAPITKCLTAPQKRAVRQVITDWEILDLTWDMWYKLKRMEGLEKIVLSGGPLRMTRGVWEQTGDLRAYIGKKDLVIELE